MRRLASWIDSRLRDSAGALSTRLRRADTSAGGQSTGSFSTEGGTVSKTACIAEGVYTYEIADTYGDGICC
jgi:hypothetical protein